MADQVPSIGVRADADSITIKLPAAEDTSIPRIPAELLDEDIPSFVAEWILEADEVGVLIQELLQAPTKSLCRIFRVPTTASTPYELPSMGDFQFGSPQVTRPVYQPKVSFPDSTFSVSGFDAGGDGVIASLPEGVQLPARLLEITEMAARVKTWIEKGERVRIWAEERGYGDASWLPASS